MLVKISVTIILSMFRTETVLDDMVISVKGVN